VPFDVVLSMDGLYAYHAGAIVGHLRAVWVSNITFYRLTFTACFLLVSG
jgi:hypothetical protein